MLGRVSIMVSKSPTYCVRLSPLRTDIGISKITKSEAEMLPNHTLPIPGDEGNYVAALSVFHQLHCLVSLPSHPTITG